ncbi:MAG: protease HtpX [Gammaproteobacteria bacterium]|nr:protease HtpX [Gammaproteobacteria bacterium]
MQRIFLFLATNLAVILLLSLSMRLFGVANPRFLLIAAIMGMGGAFISLAISKWSAKRMSGMQVIENPANPAETWLMATVQRQARNAGIGMPEVAVFSSQSMNAFATGMTRDNALVAVSTGLLKEMDKDEIEAVLAHELTHVSNGDMVTLTLIQGVVNTLVIFWAQIVTRFIQVAVFKRMQGGIVYQLIRTVVELILGLLASLVVMRFSRQREFRADAGAARLEGPNKMIRALERLQAAQSIQTTEQLSDKFAAFGISGRKEAKWKQLLASHPPLEARIEALRTSNLASVGLKDSN